MKTKEIKLDGYTLPERVKAKMILTLFRTHQAKKELGFTLCSKPDNIIVAGEDLIGIQECIKKMKNFWEGTTLILWKILVRALKIYVTAEYLR